MKLHELKTVSPFFESLGPDKKNFEVRYNDRNIQRGDFLVLSHWNGQNEFTGQSALIKVTYRIPLSVVPNFVLASGPTITYNMGYWEVFGLNFILDGDKVFWKRAEALKQAHALAK